MHRKSVSAALLPLIYGHSYAVLLQHTARGRALTARMTWPSVVIGVGGNPSSSPITSSSNCGSTQ